MPRTGLPQACRSILRPVSMGCRHLSSPSGVRPKQRALDIDTFLSVLEVSATKRDAKGYLQKYTPRKSMSRTVEAPSIQESTTASKSPVHVAIVKLRCPQHLDQDTVMGIAKTLVQLRVLGLLSVVILDCGLNESRQLFEDQSLRLCEALDFFSKPGCRLLRDVVVGYEPSSLSPLSVVDDQMLIDDTDRLKNSIQQGIIPVIPSLVSTEGLSVPQPANADRLVLNLAKYLVGLQFKATGSENAVVEGDGVERSEKFASVERIILLDPLGGTPVPGHPGASHRFVNLQQEYDTLMAHLMGPEGSPLVQKEEGGVWATIHASNLNLAKEVLSILPSSSSVLLTTPFAAVSSNSASASTQNSWTPQFGIDGMVKTRQKRNPLLHNLLTDRPVYSSSLPFQRIQGSDYDGRATGPSSAATLIKRGMPLTIYPDIRTKAWSPPLPGGPRLRLTDRCIDLPRLCHLIEDSFSRKLDMEDYLERVNENLAGIIVAGEYEGGAILTWECPDGLDRETAYKQGRLVPYLDKFAVLKSRQGAGGVADIVFTAMVNDCFPEGVCWRSRKDNPVNKWYFERSLGTTKLEDSKWTMFWTTPGLDTRGQTLRDYESVCRTIKPSWSDNK
ncbi:amino-acid N-acetyltransferase [Geosmithia morbida]|uniref:Amino-acid acetyltransferase, mitochondrial n=1 Tax=Geosmithia morbida TaxID=1094350 RepID=A0A9P4YYN8_9HYPO|nr:amino-acid N-acetyltransferase [Geosmithia morbida]KAF4125325.1 amino-acid N-acetyltransferase [Geosmithia morbida]